MKTKVLHSNALPAWPNLRKKIGLPGTAQSILFLDKKIARAPVVSRWTRDFDTVITVSAGEGLKSFSSVEKLLRELNKKNPSAGRHNTVFVACGGGSVGDAVGFAASVFKRGVPLVQVPSTWLAALDSAHGGKNAVNVFGAKNQAGTFHFPLAVVVSRELLRGQPRIIELSAWGEFFKTGLISTRALWKKTKQTAEKQKSPYELLPMGIRYKNSIVQRDPYETRNIRAVLNFGHTAGHVFEASRKIPHGLAVALGCRVAVAWSHHKGLLSARECREILKLWDDIWGYHLWHRQVQKKMSWSKVERLLAQDKKSKQSGTINAVFLRSIGRPIVKKVALSEIKQEWTRQGILK